MTNRMRKRNMPLDGSKRLVATIARDAAVTVQPSPACALRGQRDALARRLRSKLASAVRARIAATEFARYLPAYANHGQGEQHA